MSRAPVARTPLTPTNAPRSGEFFAPLPIAALTLLVTNDLFLKPLFHNAVTGKLSDIAVCFLMPLFVSELLGLVLGVAPRPRLLIGAVFVVLLYAALEVFPPFTELTVELLSRIGPSLGIGRPFRMTSDVTDLACLTLVPVAVWYGERRLSRGARVGASAR